MKRALLILLAVCWVAHLLVGAAGIHDTCLWHKPIQVRHYWYSVSVFNWGLTLGWCRDDLVSVVRLSDDPTIHLLPGLLICTFLGNGRIFALAVAWPILLTLVAMPFLTRWLWRYLKMRRRVRMGLCVVCGYDLRASTERCPECGTAITPGLAKPAQEPITATMLRRE